MNEPLPKTHCENCEITIDPMPIVAAESVIGQAVVAVNPWASGLGTYPLVGCPNCGRVFVLLPQFRR